MRILMAAAVLAASSIAAADPAASAGPAAAAKAPDVRQMHTDDCGRARAAHQPCVLDMSGESMTGSTPKSDGISSTALHIGPDTSLIRLRRDFIVEILKTAEDL